MLSTKENISNKKKELNKYQNNERTTLFSAAKSQHSLIVLLIFLLVSGCIYFVSFSQFNISMQDQKIINELNRQRALQAGQNNNIHSKEQNTIDDKLAFTLSKNNINQKLNKIDTVQKNMNSKQITQKTIYNPQGQKNIKISQESKTDQIGGQNVDKLQKLFNAQKMVIVQVQKEKSTAGKPAGTLTSADKGLQQQNVSQRNRLTTSIQLNEKPQHPNQDRLQKQIQNPLQATGQTDQPSQLASYIVQVLMPQTPSLPPSAITKHPTKENEADIYLKVISELERTNQNKQSLKASVKNSQDQQFMSKQHQETLLSQEIKKVGIVQKAQVKWPEQKQMYHVYNAMNPRFVFDVALMSNGYHDLILFKWKNSKNQKYSFRHIEKNKYKIINSQSNQVMMISQKKDGSSAKRIKFSKQQNSKQEVWELVPSNQVSHNSFYILSCQGKALDVSNGHAKQGSVLILSDLNKKLIQVWFLRPDRTYFHKDQKDVQKYYERASSHLYNIMNNQDSLDERITLEELKYQMDQKQMAIPSWIHKPPITKVLERDLAVEYWPQVTQSKNLKQEQKTFIEFVAGSQGYDFSQVENSYQPNKFQTKMPETDCAVNHTIAYVWYGNKTMPAQYQRIIDKCKNNTYLLTEQHFQKYAKMWNQNHEMKILSDIITIRQKVNKLKLLYLYYESGIYADFDTQINEKCFSQVYTDQVIWSNRIDENFKREIIYPFQSITVPEENFMMVRKKYSPQVERMILQEIMEHANGGGDRWKQCKHRQCLILYCQRNYRDNTYKKGFD